MPAASARMSSWPSALSLCRGLSERRPAHAGIERQWHPVYQRRRAVLWLAHGGTLAGAPCCSWVSPVFWGACGVGLRGRFASLMAV
jgi:hypothetical protein